MTSSDIALYLLIAVIVLLLFAVINLRQVFDKITNRKDNNTVIIVFGIFGLLCVIFSFFAPSFLTHVKIEKSNNGILAPNELGDMFGGTMAPFVGIAGVIFTFLAFYMQKVANDDIKKQFQLQQFENQFYEMLRLHKENVNEIEVIAKDTYSQIGTVEKLNVVGNLSFLQHNFEITKPLSNSNFRIFKGREAFRIMKNEFEIFYVEAQTIKLNDIVEDDFYAAYELYFWGVKGYARQDKRTIASKLYPVEFVDKLQEKILHLIANDSIDNPLNKFFSHETLKEVVLGNGYSAHLGHYYRHLYHTVKFIADDKILTYEKKRNYLKILRGQLSNYEQIMLFYNWMSNYGSSWEDSENNYFTKYKMIHNLWYNEIILDDYLKKKLACLVAKYEDLKIKDEDVRKYEENKSLFESTDEKIKEFVVDTSDCLL